MNSTSLIAKIGRFARIIRQNGGIWGSLKTLYYTDDLKEGTLVGEDSFGNKYYQNTDYFVPRSRWVVYPKHIGTEFDASMVPSEWHRWLHYGTDELPTNDPYQQYKPKWAVANQEENLTGTKGQYVPYSTTAPKVTSWVPKDGLMGGQK